MPPFKAGAITVTLNLTFELFNPPRRQLMMFGIGINQVVDDLGALVMSSRVMSLPPLTLITAALPHRFVLIPAAGCSCGLGRFVAREGPEPTPTCPAAGCAGHRPSPNAHRKVQR